VSVGFGVDDSWLVVSRNTVDEYAERVRPPAGDLGQFSDFLPGIVSQANRVFYFHTDANMSETAPWTGLEAVTRAYAKIVDQVNKLGLKDLQRPDESSQNLRRGR